MQSPFVLVRSAMQGVVWPAIALPQDATALALQYQLERSQWLPGAALEELQLRQLQVLAKHAWETVPFYRYRWHGAYEPGSALTRERFQRLPVLARADLQHHYEALKSNHIPAAHGRVVEGRTSGSTGVPVRTLKTELNELWWRVLTLRDHLWHRRDFTGRLAAIRQAPAANEDNGWGPATDPIAITGPSAILPIRTESAAQVDWLVAQQPEYLLSYPSIVAELARRCMARRVRLERLREVRTLGEVLTDEVRELCLRAWNVPVNDVYTSDEVGYVAVQCPENAGYHVQAENLVVEILDDQGRACPPGAIGRVVVTTLHNFAMPLVRYDLGDYAEAGPPCACGRGLPVLARVLGRVRNMLRLASGESYWPLFGARSFDEIAPVLQYQFVQKTFETIEARLVTRGPLTAAQEERLRAHILAFLPAGLRLTLSYLPEIPRSASGKYEDFISEVGT